MSDLTSTHTLKPEEKAIADAKIFGVADCITLGDFGRAVAVGIGDGEVLSGAEHGGGGVVVGHEKKIAHASQNATKKIIFFHEKGGIFFLTPSPISRKNDDSKLASSGGGLFFQSPLKITILVFSLASKKIRSIIPINLIKYLV